MDTESQYQWSKVKGFHARLIPAMILGALIMSIVLSIPIAIFGFGLGLRSWQSLLTAILAIGCPLGGLLGYLLGLLSTKSRLRFLKWAEATGWSFEAKPKAIEPGRTSFAKNLQQSTIFWKHAKKRYLIYRQFDDRGVRIFWAHGAVHDNFLKQNEEYSVRAKTPSGDSIFVMIENSKPCPPMNIHPREFTDYFQLPSSRPEISFESEDFNAAWVVHATDAKAAYGRVSQEVMEFLMNSPSLYLIEFVDDLLIIQHRMSLVEVRNIGSWLTMYRKTMKFVEDFMEVVPDDLLRPIEVVAHMPEFPTK
ncbi:MAG: hypothetical protein CMJ40_08275 [Phycisphaerae bacterium]|nr:hypothetical protein [Phycisphaerae bacterium]